jgi:8-oxo-dGTP diphosphatase
MRYAFSTSIYLLHKKTVLLIKHARLQCWLPVGGEFTWVPDVQTGLTRLETPIECARRESREETGIEAEFRLTDGLGEPPGFLRYEEHNAGSKGTHLNFVFAAFSETTDVKGDGSFTEHRWIELKDVQDEYFNAPPNVKFEVSTIRMFLNMGFWPAKHDFEADRQKATADWPFQCDYCKRRFKSTETLNHHYNTNHQS